MKAASWAVKQKVETREFPGTRKSAGVNSSQISWETKVETIAVRCDRGARLKMKIVRMERSGKWIRAARIRYPPGLFCTASSLST